MKGFSLGGSAPNATAAPAAPPRAREPRAPRGDGEERATRVLVRAEGCRRARELQRRARGADSQTPGAARGASREAHREPRFGRIFDDQPIRRGRGTLFGARFFG